LISTVSMDIGLALLPGAGASGGTPAA